MDRSRATRHPPTSRSLWVAPRALAGVFLFPLLLAGGACATDDDTADDDTSPVGQPYLVKDILPGVLGSFAAPLAVDARGILLLDARESVDDSYLWRSDGTETGTTRLAGVAPVGFSTSSGLWMPPNLFFVANPTQALWKSDGSARGTGIVSETSSTRTQILGAVDERIFFSTSVTQPDRRVSFRLYTYDNRTDRVTFFTELEPRSAGGSTPTRIRASAAVGDLLFFARDHELWRSDGTETGTYRVFDDVSRHGGVSLRAVRGRCLGVFAQTFYSMDLELWTSDGTATGTYRIVSGLGSASETLISGDGTDAYLLAGNGLWRTDGTAAGTRLLASLPSAPRILKNTTESGLWFRVDRELWRSRGTPETTALVKRVGRFSDPAELAGGALYFVANDDVHGYELWRSDGTPAGTELVADIKVGPGSSEIGGFMTAGTRLFFGADDGQTGRELWALRLPVGAR